MKPLIDREPVDHVGARHASPLQIDLLANYQRIAIWSMIALLWMLIVSALPLVAQAATQPVTFDQVNAIAHKMYCPVCPDTPLDVCQTQACAQWRDEIRTQLEAGQSEQQIIASFVQRYGDRVLGTPQDPALRALSLATPFLIAGLGLLIGIFTFVRWRRRPRSESAPPPSLTPIRDEYRDQLERDLRE